MGSLKASETGLAQIERAIARIGWSKSSHRWLVEASNLLEPEGNWHEYGPYAYGCSQQTWERFLQGTAIRDRSFVAFCQVLGLDADEVAQSADGLREDWGEAPDVPIFHGREREIETLEEWILEKRCRLITIVGLAGIGKTRLVRGGIGKTDLSLQLAHRIRGEFDCLIWRRLLNAPPPETILSELIEFVGENRSTQLSQSPENLVTELLRHLKQRRCLIILDNAESILQGGDRAGIYRSGYEGYGELFGRIGETQHQSCLLITSREKPRDVEDLEGIFPVRSLELGGLDLLAGRKIFANIANAYHAKFQGSPEEWETLISFYNGNPLALEISARHILRRFDGNLSKFLEGGLKIFGKIRDLLDWHFDRLSPNEREVAYWLAINREPVSISELQEDILSPLVKKQVPETLDTLERQIPLEKIGHRASLQPVLMEYLTDRFVEKICDELQTCQFNLFNRHALLKASAKEFVKHSQIRIILNPTIEWIVTVLGVEDQNALDSQLWRLLSSFKQVYRQRPGYGAGNLLNLMRYGHLDLGGGDFSDLSIWQADLQGVNLHRVDFTNCKFAKTSFTQDFGGVHSIAFHPDGNCLAIGDSIGGIRLFHLKDRQPYSYLKGHAKDVWEVVFGPNGNLLASSSMDNTIKIWDTQTGECLKTLTGHQQWIWSVAFSPDGGTVASGGDDNTVKLWNLQTGECRVLTGHRAWIWSVAFHPEGHLLASAAYDKTVRLWDSSTGECCGVLEGHASIVLAVAFHPDGQIVATGSADNTIKLWDVGTGECLQTLTGHAKEIYSIAFNGDGTLLASGSFDLTAKVWNVGTGELLDTLKGHTVGVRTLRFAPDRNILATGDNHQLLKLWDVDAGECLTTWQGYTNLICGVAISGDGRTIASGSLDKAVRLWDLPTGKLTATLTGHQKWVWSADFSRDGQLLASGSDDETIKLWDVRSGQCQKTLRGHTNGGVWTVAFSPEGHIVASGGQDGTIRLWDTRIGDNLQCLAAHDNWIRSVTFSRDGRKLVSGSDDETIKLWDVKTGECCLQICASPSKIRSVIFHPNERMLVSGGDDRKIEFWDISTGKSIQTWQGHTDSVQNLAFAPDGKFLASASSDTTIRLWQIETGECIRILRGHTSSVMSIAFTPDGQTLVSGSADSTIRLWDVKTGKALKLLQPKRPYEGTILSGVKGLTTAQEESLVALGATRTVTE